MKETINWQEIIYPECKCGCGQKITFKKYHKKYGIPNYIVGHQNRINHPMKGKKFTNEHKNKISKSHMGITPWNKGLKNPYSKEVLKKKSEKMRGKTHSEETKKRMSEAKKGTICSEETRKKFSEQRQGEKNANWRKKSKANGYSALHTYMRTRIPKPDCCPLCFRSGIRLHLTNIDHKYNQNINEWRYLCVKCHHSEDKRLGIKGRYKHEWNPMGKRNR